MPKVPILMPQLGESIAEATIIRLNVALGDTVVPDQEVIEVETNKATMGVTALCAGEVVELIAKEGVSYAVGSVLGVLEVSQEEVDRTGEQTLDDLSATGSVRDTAPAGGQDEGSNLHFKTEDGGYHEPLTIEGTAGSGGQGRGTLHFAQNEGTDDRTGAASR